MAVRVYLLSYDIRDVRRLRAMHKIATAHGAMLQYSLYACPLTRAQRIELKTRIENLIERTVDRVLILDLGSAQDEGSWIPLYESLGSDVTITMRRSVVI